MTELLAHPLIERKIEVPLAVFYEASASFDSRSPLLRLVMDEADHALDSVRFDLCHYRRLEYLPAKAGCAGGLSWAAPLADMIVNNRSGDEVSLALKAALPAFNHFFYLGSGLIDQSQKDDGRGEGYGREECLRAPIVARRITPPQPIEVDEDDAAQNPPVIDTLAAIALRKIGLNTLHLIVR